jgi:hypothetical protein
MELSLDTIQRFTQPLMDEGGDWANDYGEPGYHFPYGATTPIIVLGDFWCRCGKNPDAGKPRHFGYGRRDEPVRLVEGKDLHSYENHHPRVWAQMESQGVQFEWSDEWMVDYENGAKAYRTQADSYSWQPSVQFTDDGEYLTPDSDIEDWIEWAVNDPRKCLMDQYHWAIEEAGYTERECGFASGWFEGMNDDPVKITEAIRREHDDIDILFVLSETSQFYVRFCVFTRSTEEENDDD